MQTIERVILSALLRDMRAAGYQPAAVWDGGEYVMACADGSVKSREHAEVPARIERPLTDAEALDAIASVDDSTLHFTHRNQQTWGNRGVLVILGNGEDVISDHHCARGEGETFDAVIDAIYDRISNGGTP
jgi:hypothetical protein